MSAITLRPSSGLSTVNAWELTNSMLASPYKTKDFLRKFSHACRDMAFEIEAGTFGICRGWNHDESGNASGIGGHLLVRCGLPANICGLNLAILFFELGMRELNSSMNWINMHANVTYLAPGEEIIQKKEIIRHLREAADAAGRIAAA